MLEEVPDRARSVPLLVYAELLPVGHRVGLPVLEEYDQLLAVYYALNERQWTILQLRQQQALKES